MDSMKRMTDKIRRMGTACALLCAGCAMQTAAQGLTPAGREWMKEQRLWMQSQNAAGTSLDDTRNYSDVKLGYELQDGSFARPQEGEEEQTIGVSSEGFLDLGDAYVWGSFSFSQLNKRDAGYNASITDPYRGMPYYVADGYRSKWRNQYYDLSFRAATPVYWGLMAFGLEGTYQASLAAKQRDPRVDTRFYNLELKPGVAFTLGGGHRVGANFIYASIKEDSQMSNSDTYTDQDYYELYGLGVAVAGIGAGRTTNYHGNLLGAAVQYNFTCPAVDLLLEGSYTQKVETAEVSYTSPRKDGAVDDRNARLSLSLVERGERVAHTFRLAYQWRHIDGIQYINQRDNSEAQTGWMELYHNVRSTYETNAADVAYSIVCPREDEYSWRVDLSGRYEHQEDEYLLPNSTKDHENLYAEAAGKLNIALGQKLERRLLLGARAGYNKNLKGGYRYGGPHADYVTVTGMEAADALYLTTDYYRLGLSATYSQQLKAHSRTHLFAKAAFDYVKADEHNLGHRSGISISLGCNF